MSAPRALLFALDDKGHLTPFPSALGIPAGTAVVPPPDRTTMVPLVVRSDAMELVELWEQALDTGLANGRVRPKDFPDALWELTFVDAHHRGGSWLAGFEPLDTPVGEEENKAPEISFNSARPRTGTLLKSERGFILQVDERAERMLGLRAADLIGARSLDFMHPEDTERALDGWLTLLATGNGYRTRLRHLCGDGSWLWVEANNERHLTQVDDAAVVRTELTDISDEMATHEELIRRERLFRRTVEALPIGLLRLDLTGAVVQVNARFGALLCSPPAADAAPLLQRLSGLSTPEAAQVQGLVQRVATAGGSGSVQVRVPSAPEQQRHSSVQAVALTAEDGEPGVLLVVQDVTEAVRLQQEMNRRATTDPLTGCLNRAAAHLAVEQALGSHASARALPAVVFVDLDRFKSVNDLLGHAQGDEVLLAVAEVMRRSAAAMGDVCRLGGDEFLVVLPATGSDAAVQAFCQQLREALCAELAALPALRGARVAVGASAGAARARPGESAAELIDRADAAMYAVKNRTRVDRRR